MLEVKGTVLAGWPSPAEEELLDQMDLESYLIQKKEATFVLKVSGDSMKDAGIMPGDLVLVERGKQVKNGDIVVAQVDRRWTLKRFFKKGLRVVLYPANKLYKPIYPEEELTMEGVVVSVIRSYF